MNKEEVILAVRNESKFRNSVLGRAQMNCPLAYQEFIETRNPMKSIDYYFNKLYGLRNGKKHQEKELDELFQVRNKTLKDR